MCRKRIGCRGGGRRTLGHAPEHVPLPCGYERCLPHGTGRTYTPNFYKRLPSRDEGHWVPVIGSYLQYTRFVPESGHGERHCK